MTGKTHQIIGLSAGLVTLLTQLDPQYQAATVGWVLAASSIGSLLPDIDQPSSRMWKSLPFGTIAGELVNPFLEHRNLTHSLIGFVLIGLLARSLLGGMPAYWGVDTQVVLVSFLAAYGSHLIADMVTVQGIPLFFPSGRMLGIPPEPFQGVRIITGGWFESLVVFPVANAAFLALIIVNSDTLRTMLFK